MDGLYHQLQWHFILAYQLETERITQKDQMPVQGAYPYPKTQCWIVHGS